MFFIAGISISSFISALLLAKRDKSSSDYILFLWMLAIAVHLFLYYLNFTEYPFQLPHLLGLEIPYPLIHGVMLYYYVASVTNQLPKRKWLALLHLVPILVGYLYLFPVLISEPTSKIAFYKNGFQGYEQFMTFGLLLIFSSGIIYISYCIYLLHIHKQRIEDRFSDLEGIQLHWLQFLVSGLGAIWCIVIFTNEDSCIFTGVTLFVILIGFFGIRQKSIFLEYDFQNSYSDKNKSADEVPAKKYEKSGLKNQTSEELYKSLTSLFTQEAVYRNSQLTLLDVSKKLETHPNYISQIINEKEGKNFHDFVNSYRLNEFKELIAKEKHKELTLLGLAYECGFNSKSSFYRNFKNAMNITPAQYVKSIRKK